MIVPSSLPTVAVAGASGFIGRSLAARLAGRYNLVGLSRGPRSGDGYDAWRPCDLFSLKDAEDALAGARYAVYLVHSMMPSARLVQGRFEDLDLICADNFARAAKRAGVEQILYLGGLIPGVERLSKHLESRREVEVALGAHGVPVTTLRAGLVIGAGGSSFLMMLRLVRRLPVIGGMLAAETDRGRFEFRETPDGLSVLAAIHDFRPRLPWMVYAATQALFHLGVMHAFSRHLAREGGSC